MITSDLGNYLPEQLKEQYEPLAILNGGTNRMVILLSERTTGEKAVLKILPSVIGSCEQEYNLMKIAAGEGVPAVLFFEEENGSSFLLREYIPGESLSEYLQKKGSLSPQETTEIGIQLCRILKRLHALSPPVIHRDIKTENIIRRPDGSIVLIDFGIARRYDSGSRRDSQILGTPATAPPEQFGYRQTDPRSDIYAVGCLLHELCTGEDRLDSGEEPGVLRRIIRKCLRFDPKMRYPSAAALERALKRARMRTSFGAFRYAALLALLVIASAAFYWNGMAPAGGRIYHFKDPILAEEVSRQLGKSEKSITVEDLRQITSILLCGETPFESWSDFFISGEMMVISGQTVEESEGKSTVRDLSDLSHFPNLKELALCYEEISDLTPLEGLPLERLALHHNNISDLTPLQSCTKLQELHISSNPAEDFSPLSACGSLWHLNACRTELSDLGSLQALPSLSYLQISECFSIADYSPLAEMKNLTGLAVARVGEEQLTVFSFMPRLEHLSIWGWDEMEDCSCLAPLEKLKWLYIDMHRLSSLSGLEYLQRLENLTVKSELSLDISPVASLHSMAEIDVSGINTDDWSPLRSLPDLKTVTCSKDQISVLKTILDPGRVTFLINSLSEE